MREIFVILVGLSVMVIGLSSCGDSGEDPTPVSSYIEIAEATTSQGVVVNNFYEKKSTATRERFTIIIDSVAQSEPVTVAYVLTGTVEPGTHIEPIDMEGTVVIPAGQLSATVNYDILTSNFSLGEQFNLSIRLTGVSGGNVRLNPAYASYTNVISISCSSSIPEGIYREITADMDVLVEKVEDNTFRISNLNFRYYEGPEYGTIPGEFTDRCGTIRLNGVEIEEKYGVAWVGNGTWDPDTQEFTLTVADNTFNPEYRVVMTFRYSP